MAAAKPARSPTAPPPSADHGRAPVEPGLQEALPRGGGDLERLGPLPLGQEHRGDVESRGGEAPGDGGAVERQDGRVGDEGDLAADLETGELGSGLGEDTGADEDVVRARAQPDGDVDHRHDYATSS